MWISWMRSECFRPFTLISQSAIPASNPPFCFRHRDTLNSILRILLWILTWALTRIISTSSFSSDSSILIWIISVNKNLKSNKCFSSSKIVCVINQPSEIFHRVSRYSSQNPGNTGSFQYGVPVLSCGPPRRRVYINYDWTFIIIWYRLG